MNSKTAPDAGAYRVVHSCTSRSFSGLESYVLELVTWQYRSAKPVELYCRRGTELERQARARGIPVWTIGSNAAPGPMLWLRMLQGWRRRLRAGCGRIVLHMHAGGEPWYHLPWLRSARSILHYHIWINHPKRDPLHRIVFRGIEEVWTSSESARAHLSSLLPVSRERIRVVPYGRDVVMLRSAPREEWRRELRNKLGVGEDEVVGVCVSRLEPIKGVSELFDAFLRVAEARPGAHLVLIGDASPDNPEAARLAGELRVRHEALPEALRRRLHMPGFVSPVWPLMAAADFYVLPSYEECMSLAMLDAAILGLPILGTRSGGTPSVARPEETGMLVPPRDVEALARGLDGFYGDPALLARLGKGAAELGRGFDREQIFQRIWDWYAP